MKALLTSAAALLVSTTAVLAGGIERSNQSISILFEEGNYVEMSSQFTRPGIEGTDALGAATGDIAKDFNVVGLSYKHQFSDALSGALIIEHPYGADIDYTSAAKGGSVMLGGTRADVEGASIAGILRYKLPSNIAFHGGVRISKASGDVTLDGLAYGQVAGYRARMADNSATGWLAGVSWERPDIAARVALTYYSSVEHEFDTVETIRGNPINPAGGSVTNVKLPPAVTLDFQTGVAPDTLVYGQIRHVKWSDFKVEPQVFTALTGRGLVEIEDSTTYTLGVGRKFTDQWSGTMAVTYEPKGDELVSPLAPSNGRLGVTLAGIYTMDRMKITAGVNYTKLGDAKPATADTARAEITDADAVTLGLRIGYRF